MLSKATSQLHRIQAAQMSQFGKFSVIVLNKMGAPLLTPIPITITRITN